MKHRKNRKFVAAEAHAVLSSGEVIRMLRELKGWTQQELASQSGINATNICMLEKKQGGHRQKASGTTGPGV